MEDYQAAPISGELTGGGYAVVGSAQIKESTMGKTSFGILSAEGVNSYTLEKIISNYANMSSDYDESLRNFKDSTKKGLQEAFSNINRLLIYFTRARQQHDSLEEVISEKELNQLRRKIEGTIQFFYFIQLLGKHIYPDFKAIKDSGIKKDVKDGVFTLLTLKNIVDKIIKNQINMKDIVASPTPDNLKKALSVLEFPTKCTIKSGFKCIDKVVEYPITQFFCLEPNAPKKGHYIEEDPVCNFNYMSQNTVSSFAVNSLLEKFVYAKLTSNFFMELGLRAKQHTLALEERVRLFEKLLKTPQSKFNLTEVQRYFLKQEFPVVLVLENEDKISLYSFTTEEYRSNSGLKLGQDIKIIATDTNDHRLKIMKYLDMHQIFNIQVVLFDDLKKSREDKKRPKSPFLYPDGVPSLKWLSAKKIMSGDTDSYKKQSEKLMNSVQTDSVMYRDGNIEQVKELLHDAEEYQSICFELDAPQKISQKVASTFFPKVPKKEVMIEENTSFSNHALPKNCEDFINAFTQKHLFAYKSGFLNGFFNRTVYKSKEDYTLNKILTHAKERTFWGYKNRTCIILEEMKVIDANGDFLDNNYGVK